MKNSKQLKLADFQNLTSVKTTFKREKYEIKELGGFVYINEISVARSTEIQKKSAVFMDAADNTTNNIDGGLSYMYEMVLACVSDDEFNPVFDTETITAIPQRLFFDLFEKVQAVNGINKESVDEAVKN